MYSKYTKILAIVSLIIYIIVAALNTGSLDMYAFIMLMLTIVAAIQSTILHVLSIYYLNKK